MNKPEIKITPMLIIQLSQQKDGICAAVVTVRTAAGRAEIKSFSCEGYDALRYELNEYLDSLTSEIGRIKTALNDLDHPLREVVTKPINTHPFSKELDALMRKIMPVPFKPLSEHFVDLLTRLSRKR